MTPIGIRAFLPSDYLAARALWEATAGVGLSEADEPAAIARFLERNSGLSFVAHRDGIALFSLGTPMGE